MKKQLLLLGCAALLLVGCGAAEVRLHTTVRDSGDTEQEIAMTANGLLGKAIEDAVAGRADRDGWSVEVNSQGQSTVLRARKTFRNGEGLALLSFDGLSRADRRPLLEQENSFFHRRHTLRIPIAAGQVADLARAGGLEARGQSAEDLRQALARDLRLTWSITMPGEIESSNGQDTARNTATWELSLDKLPAGDELYVTSRSLKLGSILILVSTAVLVGLIGLTYVTLVRRKGDPEQSGHARIRI